MTTRYFKATDREHTMFRASVREYRSACFNTRNGRAFSAAPPGPADDGWVPVVEISKAEFEQLKRLKERRTRVNSPQQSWVYTWDIGQTENAP